jgi:hypothetical protein
MGQHGVIIVDRRAIEGVLGDERVAVRNGLARKAAMHAHVAEEIAEVTVVIHQPLGRKTDPLQAVDQQTLFFRRLVQLPLLDLSAIGTQQSNRRRTAITRTGAELVEQNVETT